MFRIVVASVVMVSLTSFAAGADNAAPALEKTLISARDGVVAIYRIGSPAEKGAPTYIITHGMNGTYEALDDLARDLKLLKKDANVLVVDWSPGAKVGGGLKPWAVAKRIDPTGDALAELLLEEHRAGRLDLPSATFIGESFGCYVNHRAVKSMIDAGLEKAGRALAFNPASELGGYTPPLLSAAFEESASFYTPSLFDTQRRIGDLTFLLETRTKDAREQHGAGFVWLRERINAGDQDWLTANPLLDKTDGPNDGTVRIDGTITRTTASTTARQVLIGDFNLPASTTNAWPEPGVVARG